MVPPLRFLVFCGTLWVPLGASADVAAKPADDRSHAGAVVAKALVAAVNAVVPSDIGIPPADFAPCPLEALPSSRAKILPLLPADHRRLIADAARGRTQIRRAVRGFDLLALLDDPVEATADAAAIRAFFDERTVDVALGSAVSDEPYPISFDWAVVLDTESDTLFCFILNCRD